MSNDYFTTTAVANEAIDAAGLDFVLGDIEEGTQVANKLLRQYNTCLEQLLRTAPWNIARRQVPLFLLADATGQTANVGTTVPAPWIYMYAYPTDCVRFRYIPWNPFTSVPVPTDNIVPSDSSAPIISGLGQPPYVGQRLVPARYLITSDVNYIPTGTSNDATGISPLGRTVILTNVQYAIGIYSYKAIWPNTWDANFRAAMVAYLASMIALPLAKDKKLGMAMRMQNIAIAKEKIEAARVTDGNEGWHTSDLNVDWMRFRNSGGWGGPYSWWSNVGDWNCSWESIGGWGGASTGNSSAY